MPELLMPYEVDRILRYPKGRSLRLAKANCMAHVKLPDGEIRFRRADIVQMLGFDPNGERKVAEVPHV